MNGGRGGRLGANHRRSGVGTRSCKEDVGPAQLVTCLDVTLGTLRQENSMIRHGYWKCHSVDNRPWGREIGLKPGAFQGADVIVQVRAYEQE